MTDTSVTRPAWAPRHERYTALTGELLRVLTDGISDGPEFLTLDSIAKHVDESFRARAVPRPVWQPESIGSLSFVRNQQHRLPKVTSWTAAMTPSRAERASPNTSVSPP
ncbi:hypothetical protein [Streptomyces sp. NPDC058240]|uniref:hypothetical protein n=1 Tax=Streptomyces sp. NPDC058240 TaxID=3346396 RepID=UPI0036EC23CD